MLADSNGIMAVRSMHQVADTEICPSWRRPSAVANISAGCSALLCGGLLYLLCRPPIYVIDGWLAQLRIATLVLPSVETTRACAKWLPLWAYFSLPAALWSFGGATLLGLLRPPGPFLTRNLWLMGFASLAILTECLQVSDRLPGTYDPLDLLFTIIGLAAGVIVVAWRGGL